MSTRIHAAGLAVALDGTILLNVAHVAAEQDPAALLERAIEGGGELFVGVQLSRAESRRAIALLEDRAAEAAGVIVGRRQRRRRANDRKSRSSGS